MDGSDAWNELGERGSDPELNERIKRQIELEALVSKDILGRATTMLDLRDSAVQNQRNRRYDVRAEQIMTLRIIGGAGYPLDNGYLQMGDVQLRDYLARITTKIRSRKR